MTGGFQTLQHAAGVLKKIAVGWALIGGMVVYSLLLGCVQLSKWARSRLQRPPTGESEQRLPTSRESVEK